MIPSDQLNNDLEDLPEKVAEALLEWRKSALNREKKEALLYLQFKNEVDKRTVGEIEAMIESNDDRYDAKLKEAMAECEYHRLYEKLMSAKKMADLRTAF